jgi:integrase
MNTGLRIDDVCALKTADLKRAKAKSNWLVVTEQKTGKEKVLRLRNTDIDRMLWQAGDVYVFQHRTNSAKHRARQTVWRDLARSGRPLRRQGINISPHSLRKLYAVEQYDKCRDLAKVQKLLNHDSIATTVLYVMSRELTAQKNAIKK